MKLWNIVTFFCGVLGCGILWNGFFNGDGVVYLGQWNIVISYMQLCNAVGLFCILVGVIVWILVQTYGSHGENNPYGVRYDSQLK